MDKKINKALRNYPGAATDKGENNKVTEKLVKEGVCDLNNNPRNNEDKMP